MSATMNDVSGNISSVNNGWDRAAINALLLRNARAVERALIVLHDRQTASEQSTLSTTEANGVGFSAFDAEIMSSLASAVKRGYRLSEKQLAICRRTNKHGICRLARYWAQLAAMIPAGAPAPVMPAPIDQAPDRAAQRETTAFTSKGVVGRGMAAAHMVQEEEW